jgi:hypothetical protein
MLHVVFLTFSSAVIKIELQNKEQSADGACCSDSPETTRPYLCTKFDIYPVWEPCAMYAHTLSNFGISCLLIFLFFSSYTFVYLFAGVPWHLCIKDSSVSSTLSLIQLPEHLVESTGCMGRKAWIIITTYLGFQYLRRSWIVWLNVRGKKVLSGSDQFCQIFRAFEFLVGFRWL